MMWWHDGGPGWGGWLAMTVMMLVFWGLLVAGAAALWRGARRDVGHREGRSDAERLLDERFARGEIDEADYLHRRDLIRTGR